MSDIVNEAREWVSSGCIDQIALNTLVVQMADEIDRLREALRKIARKDFDGSPDYLYDTDAWQVAEDALNNAQGNQSSQDL